MQPLLARLDEAERLLDEVTASTPPFEDQQSHDYWAGRIQAAWEFLDGT